MTVDENPRATLDMLAQQIVDLLGRGILGLYLFGSLATGDFHPRRSDIDLLAVLDHDASVDELDALRAMHEGFEGARPEWRDRIEVLYLSRAVLATFAAAPTGTVARISPGEPLHFRELEGNMGWLLDWHGVVTTGETLSGAAPLTLGPAIDDDVFRIAVRSQLKELPKTARDNSVAYVPVNQGYILATVARALYSLEVGSQTSKATAVEWYAERNPDDAEFVRSAYRAYRADVRGPHQRLIELVDKAAREID